MSEGRTACVWESDGATVTERRAAFAEEYPSGPCEPVSQERNCTCAAGAPSCTEFVPAAAAVVCTSGCGVAPHGAVLWEEHRVRFASELSVDCVPQTQGRGPRCVGEYAGETNGTFRAKATWCVRDGAFCSGTVPLALFHSCARVVAPPSTVDVVPPVVPPVAAPAWPPPAVHTRQNIDVDASLLVPLLVGSGLLLAAALLAACYLAWERRRRSVVSRAP